MSNAPDTCPLCGGPNACGMVAGAEPCWCFDVRIASAVLARIPAEARDKACICRACAMAEADAAAGPSSAPARTER